jgi:hypothetical protein
MNILRRREGGLGVSPPFSPPPQPLGDEKWAEPATTPFNAHLSVCYLYLKTEGLWNKREKLKPSRQGMS